MTTETTIDIEATEITPIGVTLGPLSVREQGDLERLEALINTGLKSFYEVGAALMMVRDKRLYRECYSSFEDYCAERWAMTRTQGDRLINAAKVAENLTPIGVIPANESQARPLAKLEPEQQRQIWREVLETAIDGKPTAAQITAAVKEMEWEFNYSIGEAVEIIKQCPIAFLRGQSCVVADIRRDPPMVWVRFVDHPLAPPVEVEPQYVRKIQCGQLSNPNSHDEHYTPPEIARRVDWVLEGIELDPCSNSKTIPNISAQRYWTREDNGLYQPWLCRTLYMNPPYSELSSWCRRLSDRFKLGDIDQGAIVLVPCYTDTNWWDCLMGVDTNGRVPIAPTVCFLKGRLTFGGNDSPARFPSAVLYFGFGSDRFCEGFGDLGRIVQEVGAKDFT